MKSFIFILIPQIKEFAIGGACGTNEKYWSENVKGRDHKEDIGMDKRITLRWM
jgi:hypothetical protein